MRHHIIRSTFLESIHEKSNTWQSTRNIRADFCKPASMQDQLLYLLSSGAAYLDKVYAFWLIPQVNFIFIAGQQGTAYFFPEHVIDFYPELLFPHTADNKFSR